MSNDYKEALERARKIKHDIENAGCSMSADMLDIIFPELDESEDEKIRKAISAAICGTTAETVLEANGVRLVDALAYLEKQKEPRDYRKLYEEVVKSDWFKENYVGKSLGEDHQPAEWSEKHIADIFEKVGLAKIAREQRDDELTNALQDAMLELSKVENAEWSEEDENALEYLDELIGFGYSEKFMDAQTDADLREWVNKSLRHSWRPSEEQMDWLESAVRLSTDKPHIHGIIISLYEQLKRLL